MIPFLKPYFNHRELLSIVRFDRQSVEKFEKEFAKKFDSRFALSFSSGRSALYCTLLALGINNSEIILPAYTCVVVAHAVILSRNTPVFVDISLDDFNMDLDLLSEKVSARTKVVIATSLFGYPIQLAKIRDICGGDVLIIHDCALAPGVKYKGIDISSESDIAIYSFNVRKPISTLGGGMVGTNNEEIFEKIRDFRERNQVKYSNIEKLGKLLFFLSQFVAFNRVIHGLVDFLSHKTHLLDSFLIDYSEDMENIPSRYFKPLLDSQAKIGLAQLEKYDNMLKKKREIAKFYYENLKTQNSTKILPIIEGAIYSHYCIRVSKRQQFTEKIREKGISVGRYFDYSIPELEPYSRYKDGVFPNSLICSKEMVNLPNHPGLRSKDLDYIMHNVVEILSELGE